MELARPLPRPCPLLSGTVRRLNIPIHVPFSIARQSLPEAQIALVELRNAQGLRGLGEIAPFPVLTGDTIALASATALQLLEEIRGLDSEEALRKLSALRPEIIARSITAYVGIEGALWDLYAREQGLSLADLWGGSSLKRVQTDITLPIMDAASVAHFWSIFRGHNFPLVKVKVSGHVGQDLEMIHELRSRLPREVKITLDGNQGFSEEQAIRLVECLAASGCHPLFFEQPLPAEDERGQTRLQARLPIPLCADESIRSVADARRVIEKRMAGIINIKIMKSGIAESLAIIELARASKLPLMIGGMLESEVAMGISLQMACGTAAFAHFDLDTPFFFKNRVTMLSPWHAGQAELHLPAGHGHGLRAFEA